MNLNRDPDELTPEQIGKQSEVNDIAFKNQLDKLRNKHPKTSGAINVRDACVN